MCGIAGTVNKNISESKIFDALLHRGPDAQSSMSHANVNLYHLRLSIIDAVGGEQPMSLKGRYHIVFNGEIYNYKDLISKFDLVVKSKSDTEVLLLLYEKFGIDFLNYLEGMFAFAIYDQIKETLVLVRDRAGKKPLYYYQNNNSLFFCSELNCMRSCIDLEIDDKTIGQYLRLGSCYRDRTPYRNVKELGAGSYLVFDTSSLELLESKKWWDILDFYEKDKIQESEAEHLVDNALRHAVRRRMLSSDLEVGSFLSGGIDSGLVTAIASEYTTKLKTFTVSFDGAYDEAPLAKLVSDKYDTNHHEINISFDNLENDIEKIVSSYGEPFFDSSAIPSYYVSKAAKEYVTVVLNGDGADELLGGYRRYVPFSKYDFFNSSSITRSLAKTAIACMPLGNSKKSKYNLLYRLVDLASKDNINTYLSATSDIFEGYESNLKFDFISNSEIEDDFNFINSKSNLSGLDKIMALDFQTLLFNDLLVKMDIATMNNSLEGRSPFLCKDLLELAPRILSNQKVSTTNTKLLLRKLALKYLPDELINQPKRGFEIPLKNWVNNNLKIIINDYLLSKGALWKNFINEKWVVKMLDNKLKIPAEKRAKMIWTIFCLEVWNKHNS